MPNEPATTPAAAPEATAAPSTPDVQATAPQAEPSGGQSEVQTGAEGATQEPQNLSDALGMIIENNESGSSETVQSTNADGGNTEPPAEPAQSSVDTTPAELGANADDSSAGGFDTSRWKAEYNRTSQRITADIKQRALADANKALADRQIKELSLKDIQRQDENSNRIIWNNPYNPNEPFTTMKEARDFINAYNAEVDTERQRIASEQSKIYAQRYAPAMRLRAFEPVWDSLSEAEKVVCGQLTENYAVKNNAGAVVGFNCDLNEAARMARSLVSSIAPAPAQAPATPAPAPASNAPVTTPALDINTSSNAPVSNELTPDKVKNMTDAFNYVNQTKGK